MFRRKQRSSDPVFTTREIMFCVALASTKDPNAITKGRDMDEVRSVIHKCRSVVVWKDDSIVVNAFEIA